MADLGLYEEIQHGSARDQETVLKHVGLVKRVALHLKARIPAYMELDELMQVGMIGLIEASKSFDASKGIEFEAFARNRVRGAILDEVRKLSDLPRSAVGHVRENNEAQQALAAELGRAPTQTELAAYLGKDIDQYQRERAHAHHFQVVAMDELQSESLEASPSDYGEPELDVENAEFMDELTRAIERLPERDRLVVSLYYVEEMNLKEIGAVLEVSESRVSQILSQSVKTLRSRLAASF
jgi:RNA polymerase sigma factor for flagellar operon FliA